MLRIAHRINTRAQLEHLPTDFGAEVDIRSRGEDLIIHHDPFHDGEMFENWLAAYRHRLLILNVKEEGLEQRLLSLMDRHGIQSFFFLDQSFPFLIRTARAGERRCAVRVSEYEAIDTALSLAGMVDWVWVDCFSSFPLTGEKAKILRDAGFKLCFVSPELHGRTGAGVVQAYRDDIARHGLKGDAVCTKLLDAWA